jgi:hypothetical protein
MLLKILKPFALDVPAKIESAKASLGLRVEQATDHRQTVAVEAASIAALSAIATITVRWRLALGSSRCEFQNTRM